MVLLAGAAITLAFLWHQAWVLTDSYSAYRGVVVGKSISGWSMLRRRRWWRTTEYNIVVRDSTGRESTHHLSSDHFSMPVNAPMGDSTLQLGSLSLSVRAGDSVTKASGFFNGPRFTRPREDP